MPNLLTAFRLVLAAAFFTLLSFYQYEGRGDPWLMTWAFAVYIGALITDYLDGYLARKWDVPSQFGRVVDPFADKILVLGSFIFFAGKNFIIPEMVTESQLGPRWVMKTITGVVPGMVVVLLARELLVTSLRGISEGSGQSFAAVWAGKFKMAFQSGTIFVILVYVAFYLPLKESGYEPIARIIRDIGVWGTIVITLYSGLAYVRKALAMARMGSKA